VHGPPKLIRLILRELSVNRLWRLEVLQREDSERTSLSYFASLFVRAPLAEEVEFGDNISRKI